MTREQIEQRAWDLQLARWNHEKQKFEMPEGVIQLALEAAKAAKAKCHPFKTEASGEGV